jgi:hypothetical protein
MTQFYSVAHGGNSSYMHSSTQNHIRCWVPRPNFGYGWHWNIPPPRVLGLVATNMAPWHVTTRTTPSQPHVFVCRPECVNDSLVLGTVVKQIAQRKEGMFPQV